MNLQDRLYIMRLKEANRAGEGFAAIHLGMISA
jgi:hypothetical protein